MRSDAWLASEEMAGLGGLTVISTLTFAACLQPAANSSPLYYRLDKLKARIVPVLRCVFVLVWVARDHVRYQVVDDDGDAVGRHGCIVACGDGGLTKKRGGSKAWAVKYRQI